MSKYPKPGIPRPVDVHAGHRLRQIRTLQGMSQEKLGEKVGLSFQQVQKYERGANRMGASRLFEFAQIFEIEIQYFFDEMSDDVSQTNGARAEDKLPALDETHSADPMAKRETLELVRAYYAITDPKVRKRFFELAKSIAKDETSLPAAAE